MTRNIITRVFEDKSGATAIEYGLILAFVSGAIIAVFPQVQIFLNGVFAKIEASLATAP